MTDQNAKTNELTITLPGETPLVVDASKFRAKPVNITRDRAAEFAYDEFLGEDERDTIDSDDALNALLAGAVAGEITNKHVLSFLAVVSREDELTRASEAGDDDATAKLPKKTQRARFERDLRRYQPAKSRASKYSGQTRSQLKTRIAQLEAHISGLAEAMTAAGLDVPEVPEFSPEPPKAGDDSEADDAGDDE